MNDWSDGYVTQVDYTYGFYKEMTPVAMRFALLAAGLESPVLDRFNYCELGFGQGAGLNLMAAANPQGQFWGTDFNPAHAAGAEQMASNAGLENIHVFDDSFEQFAARDLPKFDFISLHGIYSWVGAANCRHIVNFIDRHLKVGGVVYVSYNTLPGWTHALPMRGLLTQYAQYQSALTDTVAERLDGALKLLGELNEIPGSYFKQTPQLSERIKGLQGQDRNYMAHEYLNQHWTPIFFSQMVGELAEAKLTFSAHANPLNCIDALNHTPELQAVLDKIPDPIFREVVRDLGVNQTFRRDLFVRGPRKLSRADQAARLLETSYALVTPRQHCNMRIKTTIGEAQLQANVYEPLLDRLVDGPCTGRDLLSLPMVSDNGGPARLMQALVVMVGSGYLQPGVAAPLREAALASCARFNDVVTGRTQRGGNAEFNYLASARLGSGVSQGRLNQLFLRSAQERPAGDARSHADAVSRQLAASGQILTKNGQRIEDPEASIQELLERLAEWTTGHRAIAQHLDILR